VSGHEVITGESGRLGLQLIKFQKPDMVICDMVMPEMGGCEVIEALHNGQPEFATIPFIFISALAGEQDVKDGLCLGACDYIIKPIDFDKLTLSINKHLENKSALRSGDLVMTKGEPHKAGPLSKA